MQRGSFVTLILCSVIAGLLVQPSPAAELSLRVTYSFGSNGLDGNTPTWIGYGPDGDIYGTTAFGGTLQSGGGTVFKLHRKPDGTWQETVLWRATSPFGPSLIQSNLVFDSAGRLYGTSLYGGAHGFGTFFQLSPMPDGTWHMQVVHDFDFDGIDAYYPLGYIAVDSSDNVFGAGSSGGQYQDGAAFEFSPRPDGSFSEKLIHEWKEDVDGSVPHDVIIDVAGNLYGGTFATLWRLSPVGDGTYSEKILHSLSGSEGNYPNVPTLGADGALYGTLWHGGPGFVGSAYKLAPNANDDWTYAQLGEFHRNHRDGIYPWGRVTVDTSGNLYGVNGNYGANGAGTLFRLSPNTNGRYSKIVLYSFGPPNDTVPAYPQFGLLFDSEGHAFGVSNGGGDFDQGAVYQITIKTSD